MGSWKSRTGAAALAAGVLGLGTGAGAAWSADPTAGPERYVTVLWTENVPGVRWPQHVEGHRVTTEPDLGAFDARLVPVCVPRGYQVDVYRYTEAADRADVDRLLAGGVLRGPGNPVREPLVAAKVWEDRGGTGCATPSPSTTTTAAPPPITVTTTTAPAATHTRTRTVEIGTAASTTRTSAPVELRRVADREELPRTGPADGTVFAGVLGGALLLAGGAVVVGTRRGRH